MRGVSDPVNPPPYVPTTAPVPPAAPHGGYAPPAGYGPAPYAAPYVPAVGYGPAPAAPAPGTSTLGLVALLLALGAAALVPITAAVAAFNVGLGTGRELVLSPSSAGFDWSILTPVRDWVLLGEISFWAGTALGVWALVQGIVAIVRRRGRGQGIAAVVLAGLGPVLFAIALQVALGVGLAGGASIAA